MDVRAVVDEYTNAIGQGDFARLGDLVHEDATFGGTVMEEARGRDGFVRGFRNLAPITEGVEVRDIVVDGEHAAVLYDFVTDTPAGRVLCSEFLHVADGRVRASTLMFDWRRWPEVLTALRDRQGS